MDVDVSPKRYMGKMDFQNTRQNAQDDMKQESRNIFVKLS